MWLWLVMVVETCAANRQITTTKKSARGQATVLSRELGVVHVIFWLGLVSETMLRA